MIETNALDRVRPEDFNLLSSSDTEMLFYLKYYEHKLLTPHLEGAYLNHLGSELANLEIAS